MRLAVDFGMTNTVAAIADESGVRILHLPGLARELPTDQSPLIPTAISVTEHEQVILVFFRRRTRSVLIGQQALNQNYGGYSGMSRSFAQCFKPYLGATPHRPVIRAGEHELSAREVTALFLREAIAAVKKQAGFKVRHLTMSVPVGFYETYRAELQAIARSLKVKVFLTLDEPVAAAIGYGVSVVRDEVLLVVDFGGGTLDLAALRLGRQAAESGAAPVLAKHMVDLGGAMVDRWILERFLPDVSDLPEWQYDATWEAMRTKEEASRDGSAEFRWNGIRKALTRADLIELLTKHGFYNALEKGLCEIREQLAAAGCDKGPDEVLLVGGSTLLPEVAATVDRAFPRAVVRHDPEFVFTAVAAGAARYAGGLPVDDFIYHDYAIAVQNEQTHAVEYELLIPRRTRYPTASDFAVRYYADYAGMTEMRLQICEMGRLGQTAVTWTVRANGNSYWAPGTVDERAHVMELNPADEPVVLRPAGVGTSPRLRATFFINAERWVCVTVDDLVRKETLRLNQPVVRLR